MKGVIKIVLNFGGTFGNLFIFIYYATLSLFVVCQYWALLTTWITITGHKISTNTAQIQSSVVMELCCANFYKHQLNLDLAIFFTGHIKKDYLHQILIQYLCLVKGQKLDSHIKTGKKKSEHWLIEQLENKNI